MPNEDSSTLSKQEEGRRVEIHLSQEGNRSSPFPGQTSEHSIILTNAIRLFIIKMIAWNGTDANGNLNEDDKLY